MSTPNAPPLRVLHLTDTHLYDDPAGALKEVVTERSLAAVIAAATAGRPPPDLVLATGDLVHEAGAAAYRRLRRRLADLGVPVHCLPGNHDPGPLLRTELAAAGTDRVDCAPWTVHGDWGFVLLDSSVPGDDGGHLGDAELAHLAACLAAPGPAHVLVCLHHNPVPLGSAWLDTMTVDNGDALFGLLDTDPRVRGVLWGHVHQAYSGQRGALALLGTPSTCVQFLPGSRDFALDRRPPGWRWLELHGDAALPARWNGLRAPEMMGHFSGHPAATGIG